jgi:hypothetical protein
MSKPKAYAITCPKCGAPPWHACITTEDTRFKDFIGKPKRRVHKERAVDAQELHEKYIGALLGVECPSCGALPGARCRRTSKPTSDGGWQYCAPWGKKNMYCVARIWRVQGRASLDNHASAADEGMLAEDFHESCAHNGLLSEGAPPASPEPVKQPAKVIRPAKWSIRRDGI